MGLTLAMRLAERGYQVALLEAADNIGGLADAWQLGNITWDRHYHVTLNSDTHLRRLLAELGLDDEMEWVQTRTGFVVDGRLMSLSSTWDFLRFPPLRLLDKYRLARTIWRTSRMNNWEELEQIPVADWLVRQSGRRTFERIWLPLLKAKLGDAWRRTSAAFIWATIQRMYAARRAGLKREFLGYLPGGYARMLNRFQTELEKRGVEIRTSYRAEKVQRNPDGSISVRSASGESLTFDRVIVTAAAPIAARLCRQLTDDERERLASVEYLGIVCASLLLRQPLSDYYVTNITDAAPFTGVIEMTALVDPAEFGSRGLVYLPKYATADDPIWSRSDDEVRSDFLAGLSRIYPHFAPADLLAFRVSRVKHVFALSTLGYSRRVPPVQTSVPGLFVVNAAQIVNGTLNVNETVRLAEASIDAVCQPLDAPDVLNYESIDRELVARPG